MPLLRAGPCRARAFPTFVADVVPGPETSLPICEEVRPFGKAALCGS